MTEYERGILDAAICAIGRLDVRLTRLEDKMAGVRVEEPVDTKAAEEAAQKLAEARQKQFDGMFKKGTDELTPEAIAKLGDAWMEDGIG